MSHLLLILPVIGLAVVSPGADFALVSRVSCIDGRRAGIMAALGIAIGCWFHIAYAVFGLGIVAHMFPQFLNVLKIAGAAYLVWLGWTMVTARPVALAVTEKAPAPRGGLRSLTTGLLTNALNPKTSIFVVSLYAQAIGPDTPLSTKLGYGAVISLLHLAWFAGVATFLSRPMVRAWVLARQHMVNRGIGTVLILLGIALGFADIGGQAALRRHAPVTLVTDSFAPMSQGLIASFPADRLLCHRFVADAGGFIVGHTYWNGLAGTHVCLAGTHGPPLACEPAHPSRKAQRPPLAGRTAV